MQESNPSKQASRRCAGSGRRKEWNRKKSFNTIFTSQALVTLPEEHLQALKPD